MGRDIRRGTMAKPAVVSGCRWGVLAFLTEKLPLILFGTFPYEERWRALVVSFGLLVMSAVTLFQWFSWRWQAFGWLVSMGLFAVLMGGGVIGLTTVSTAQWNGLPVLLFGYNKSGCRTARGVVACLGAAG